MSDRRIANNPKKIRNPKNRYACLAPTSDSAQYLLSRLGKDIVIADWQYNSVEFPLETASVFQKAGFNCLLCPWDRGKAQTTAALSTIKTQKLNGLLHTTWHTLSSGMPYVTVAAVGCFEDIENRTLDELQTGSAALLRKVMPSCGDYAKAGWSKIQVHNLW